MPKQETPLKAGDKIREYVITAGPFDGFSGQVFICEHCELHLTRAIKRLHAEIKDELIREEALKLAAVRSPNVVQIIDYFKEHGRGCIVMECCKKSLKEVLLDRFAQTQRKIPYDEARDMVSDIVGGLWDAHGKGIVHGDMKPANVRLGDDGLLKLSDFGAACWTVGSGLALRGSANWMAPELLPGGKPTKESDYFSLGVLAYIIMTGRHPYESDDPSGLTTEADNIGSTTFRPETISLVRNDVPKLVADLIMELLSRDPEARSRAAEALKTALQQPGEEGSLTSAPAPVVAPPEHEPANLDQLRSSYELAKFRYFGDFRPREALDVLDKALAVFDWKEHVGKRTDVVADCWQLRAFICCGRRDYAGAEQAADNALSIDHEHVNALHTRGLARVQLGKDAEAEKDLLQAYQLASDPKKREQVRRLLNLVRERLHTPRGSPDVDDHRRRRRSG